MIRNTPAVVLIKAFNCLFAWIVATEILRAQRETRFHIHHTIANRFMESGLYFIYSLKKTTTQTHTAAWDVFRKNENEIVT